MVQRFDWTKKRLDTLRAEYAEKGAKHFAELWGMTTAAVAGRASRMGLKYVGLWKQTEPANDLGDRAQMRRQQVAKIVRQMEAPMGKRGDGLEIVERVAAKKAPKRRCSWRETDGNGFRVACCAHAVPGKMWCETHLEAVGAIKESA